MSIKKTGEGATWQIGIKDVEAEIKFENGKVKDMNIEIGGRELIILSEEEIDNITDVLAEMKLLIYKNKDIECHYHQMHTKPKEKKQ
jgi:hypothetical protein